MPDLYQVDLLEERRLQLGLSERVFVDGRSQLRKGVALGAVAVGLVIGLLAWFGVRLWTTRHAADALEPTSQRYTSLQQAVQGSRGRLKGLKESNTVLVDQILSFPSSSALLTLLARLTPQGVQLTDLSEKDGALVMKGRAVDPEALTRLDALMLNLAASPLIERDSLALLKAERGKGETGQAPAAAQPQPQPQPQLQSQQVAPQPQQAQPAPPPPPPQVPAQLAAGLQFELQASFSKTAPKDLVREFLALGARGKALRVAQLQREGLLR